MENLNAERAVDALNELCKIDSFIKNAIDPEGAKDALKNISDFYVGAFFENLLEMSDEEIELSCLETRLGVISFRELIDRLTEEIVSICNPVTEEDSEYEC